MGKIAIVGCGGIGSRLAKHFQLPRTPLTLVDGDRDEEKNLDRQFFVKRDIGKYKVEALGKARDTAVPYFIKSASDIEELLRGISDLFIGVDNNLARAVFLKYLLDTPDGVLKNTRIYWLGNADNAGEAIYDLPGYNVYDTLYPEVKNTSSITRECGCSEAIGRGDEQTPLANLGACTLGLLLHNKFSRHKELEIKDYDNVFLEFSLCGIKQTNYGEVKYGRD